MTSIVRHVGFLYVLRSIVNLARYMAGVSSDGQPPLDQNDSFVTSFRYVFRSSMAVDVLHQLHHLGPRLLVQLILGRAQHLLQDRQ